MPAIKTSSPYSSEGSVPNVTASGPATPEMNVHASPQDFGAQVGGAIEKAGNEGFDLAMKQQGMINETQMNQAEVGFIKDSGDLRAKYSQYEGLQAEAARPQYAADLAALHAQYRQGLSPIVQKGFDSTTLRQMANQTNEYSGYAAGQVKQANVKSQDAVGDTAVAGAGNLATVLDNRQFNGLVGAITHTGNALSDIHGDSILATGLDDGKGNYSYPNTPEGQAAQARHMQYTNAKLGQLYLTGAKTIADNQGSQAAADWAKAHWDVMPDAAKVRMNQYLAPKMVNEDIDGAIATANSNMAANKEKQLLSNVPASVTSATPSSSDLLGVIHRNEGFTGKIGTDSNGANVVNGINEKAFPQDYAIINTAYGKSKAEGDAATNDFYQKNILDKYDIKSLPPATQAIVADGLVNHTPDFGKSLLAAAKNGDTPQQLIDMRRVEYQRLANADTDGSHGWVSSLKGWNNRLDSLEPKQQYSNDYERLTTERQPFIDNAVNAITEKRGSDLALMATTQKRAEANIDAQIRVAKGVLDSDQKSVQGAIDGSTTKGQVPMTLEALRDAPNMAPLLDKVQREQPEFYNSILTRIAKAQHANATQNSPNAYDAIQATLDTTGRAANYGRQERIEYLSKGLGSDNPGFSISQKDFNDAKPAIDLTDGKETLAKNMSEIASANGNLDGKGQARAVQWYNQVMTAYKQKPADMSDTDFFAKIGEKDGPPAPSPPSRLEQLNNWARNFSISTPAKPTAQNFDYNAVQKGQQYTAPDGTIRTKQ